MQPVVQESSTRQAGDRIMEGVVMCQGRQFILVGRRQTLHAGIVAWIEGALVRKNRYVPRLFGNGDVSTVGGIEAVEGRWPETFLGESPGGLGARPLDS